jgi:serine/threonine protein kinase/Leucine-rich repeat (LRR) protein
MKERELFLAALEIDDPAARKAHLESNCVGDAALLDRVKALLASHESQSQFLRTPVVQQMADTSDAGLAATILLAEGDTRGRNLDPTIEFAPEAAEMTRQDDDAKDDIYLGFLEPSSKPGSIGRLAHYEVLDVVGRGAFGTVLRAFDEKLHRVIAIKVLAPEMAATSPARKRFLREAQASAAIRHENVVSIHAVEEKPLPYLVMEYIPGLTLQQRLDERGPLDIATVLRLGRQIAEGLAAAHDQHLIHRDIKPGNILLETGVQDRVKITDFGLARAADDASLTQSGTIAGTPMYMAPEQALGHKLDHRADLFSFGSVLYQMVSGRPPFRAPTSLAVLKRVAEEAPRPIQEIIPETPQWLCDIITKLHAKNPDERYQSAREIAAVLADCEAQLKAHAGLKDLSLIPRSKPHPSGWRKWIALTAVMCPLMAFGLYTLNRPSEPLKATGDETSNKLPEPAPIKPDSALAASQVKEQGASKSENWVQLFNGKDLTGWKFHPDQPGDWNVRDGVLRGSTRQSHLFSQRGDYENFRLRAEVKINLGGDSGLLFRAPFDLRRGRTPAEFGIPGCYEVELQENRSHLRPTGSISEATAEAAPTNLSQAIDRSLTQPDEWFSIEVIAENNHFTTKINNIEAANCTDPLRKHHTGHLALQVWNPNTLVQFRKIEIMELPSSGSTPVDLAIRRFASEEWINVIPLVDPRADKWNNPLTGLNEWRRQGEELVTGYADVKPGKLLLPLDADWRSYEWEIEFTRRSGPGGFNVNLPSRVGDCPVTLNPPNKTGVFLGNRESGIALNDAVEIVSGKRSKLRLEVRKQESDDRVSVWFDDAAVGTWAGDIASIAITSNEGYPSTRRLSLWIHGGGNEIAFHRIRVRPLDGGTAATLRPVSPPASNHLDAFTDADVRRIAALSAEQQMEEVRKELLRRNVSFDGKAEHKIEDGAVTELNLTTDQILDISPLRALQGLVSLKLGPTPRPGKRSKLSDISSLAGLHLKHLDLGCTEVTNIEVVKTMPLETLSLDRAPVTDLSPLTGKVLKSFHFGGTKVKNLSEVPIAGSEVIHCHLSQISDTSVFQRWGVRFLDLWGVPTSVDPERLRVLKPPLSRVNGKPLEEFLQEAATANASLPPFSDADAARIAALPAAEQVEEVRAELMKRNPGFDGMFIPKINDGVVTELHLNTDKIVNISPVRALAGLIDFDCRGTYPNKGKLSDIAPLHGMKFTRLDCSSTQVADLSPLIGMPLTFLQFNHNPVSDLSPIKGMPLETLGCAETQVSDLSPLKGMQLKVLGAQLLPVTDLSPLQGMPLTGLDLYHTVGVTSLEPLKGMPLEGLNLQDVPVSDLSPLAGMTTLRSLLLQANAVTDLAPLQGLQLTDLILRDKQITDLSPLKGQPLRRLEFYGTSVTDLSPLRGMPLHEVRLSPGNITKGIETLRDVKTLMMIGIDEKQAWPPAEFWERYDRGDFSK